MSGGIHLPSGMSGGASVPPDDHASIALVKIASIFQRFESAVIMHTMTDTQVSAVEAGTAPRPENMNWVVWLGSHMQTLERGVVALERIATAMEDEVQGIRALAEMQGEEDPDNDESEADMSQAE